VPVVWVVREHHASGVDAEVTRAHLYKDGKGPVALLTPGEREREVGSEEGRAKPMHIPALPHARTPRPAHTPGSELVDGLHPAPGEHVISKKRFSAFWGTGAASLLRRLGVGHVVLAGVQTPNCVRATAFDAVSEDFPAVSVLADATASATDEVQASNLADLRAVGVATPTLAEWKASLGGGGLVSLLFGR